MGRPVVLSNGQLFVGLDENGLVHDFYYPYVGLDNLTNARSSQHKIGLWVDGKFHWTDDQTWDIKLDFEDEALISSLTMQQTDLKILLQFQDFVDPVYNTLVRQVTVTNQSDKERDIRIFMHQVFQIGRAGRADTAMYVPDDHYLLDYKGRCCLLIAGKFEDGTDFDQYAVGSYGVEDKVGTFVDAEDGELSGNPVEHGGVDSVLRFRKQLSAEQSVKFYYWIVAADSQSDAQVIHSRLKYYPLADRLTETRRHWQAWLSPARSSLQGLSDEHNKIVTKSLLIIKAHCDERGSILASGDSSIFNYGRDYYCYCWPRDAAFAIWPLIRLGIFEEARKFFAFARDTLHRDGYLMHKYQPDRAIGSTWHPLIHGRNKELAIQEDETAIVLFMLGEYYRFSKDTTFIENYYESFIAPAAHFISNFIDPQTGLPHASYDLWEERFLTNTYTVSCVIAGLDKASQFAELTNHPEDAAHWRKSAEMIRSKLDTFMHPDGFFCKGFLLETDGTLKADDALDISSLYGPYMFAGLDLSDARLTSTFEQVAKRLENSGPIGGIIRYEGDSYFLDKKQYKGNPWIICSLWMAQYLNATNRPLEAQKLLKWAIDRQLPSGALSEQFDPDTGKAVSVTPLVWSHAEMVNTILDLTNSSQSKTV
ncbi:MAG TPA: glycoside hydrolase family 15 protein [Candidatus Dormibacteraeota bacterium]|nr:glycoside hydrolase family 15 protein [Candidatus Dormibacteraeota bacterium]